MKRIFSILCCCALMFIVATACAKAQSVYRTGYGRNGPAVLAVKNNVRPSGAGLFTDMDLSFAIKDTAPSTQPGFSYVGLYRFKDHSFTQVVLGPTITRIDLGSYTAKFPDVTHFHLAFNIALLAGVSNDGDGTAGLAATLDPIALTTDHNWNLLIGGYGRWENNTPLITGLIIGGQVVFKT